MKTNGDRGEIFITKSGSHDRIDNPGPHLSGLSEEQRPAYAPEMLELGRN
jgi:hypothetical protein